MKESEVKQLWQSGTNDRSITMGEKNDLGRYESQYNKILNKVNLLHDRGFQIGIFILSTIGIIYLPFTKTITPFLYLLSVLYVFGLWYIFFLYEKLRAIIREESIDTNQLAYFRRKRDIIMMVATIQKVSSMYYILLILFLFRARLYDINSDYRFIILFLFIAFMALGSALHYRKNTLPTVIYLKGLVKHLAEES